MKTPLFVLSALLLSSVAMAADLAPAGKYSIDSAHSKVGFEINHLVISTVEGRFNKFAGDVNLGAASAVNAEIEVASIDTGIAKRDDHLRSKDFFDAKKFPKITFKSKSFTWTDNKDITIVGDLTLHGVTKEVTLTGKFLGSVKDQFGKQRIALKASSVIKRKDFGLTWNSMVEAGPVVGDDVTINLKVEATI